MIKKALVMSIFFLTMSLGAMDLDKKLIIDAATAGLIVGAVLIIIESSNQEQTYEMGTLVRTNDEGINYAYGIKPEVSNFCPIL